MSNLSWRFATIAVALVTAAVSAGAQPHYGGGHERPHYAPAQQRPMQPPPPHMATPPYYPGAHQPPRVVHPSHIKRMGAGPQHNWQRGSRVPPQYRTKHYVVQRWQDHDLQRPPRGHQWIQYGPDYLLIATATGLITQLVLGY